MSDACNFFFTMYVLLAGKQQSKMRNEFSSNLYTYIYILYIFFFMAIRKKKILHEALTMKISRKVKMKIF